MQINLRETDKQRVYITSDPHLGHNPKWQVPLWQSRGYNNVSEHDNAIIDSFNSNVRPDDILIIVGDFCLNTTIEGFNAYLARIQCQNLWYLNGNHNNPHEKAIFRKAMGSNYVGPCQVESYPFKYKNMTYFGDRLKLVWNGQFCVLDHFPIYVWEEMQHGAWMLCGHSHYGCEWSQAENKNAKILDCGWDGHKKPLSFKDVKAIMDTKTFVPVDHHA